MKLLIIHQAFATPADSGGTRHFELARHLVLSGHEVVVIASRLSYLTGRATTTQRGEVIDGVRIIRVWTLASLHRSFVWRVMAFFSFMLTSTWAAVRVRDIDLVMGTSPPIFQAASAWLVAAVRRKRFLLEIRDLWPEFAIEMGVLRNGVLIAMSRWLEAFLYGRADHLLVNSPAYREYLLKRGIPDGKVSFIANGVEWEAFAVDPQLGRALRSEWNAHPSSFIALYAGAIGQANDIPVILKAADRLKNDPRIRFVLVGDGKERANLQKMVAENRLGNVLFVGPVPKGQMPGVLNAADVCIASLQPIPMFSTTYPNKVFDYMAAGKPTALAIDGVIRRVIEDSDGGRFVTPGDDAALARVLTEMVNNPGDVEEMGTAAREYVRKHFDRRIQACAFRELVERLS